MEHTKANYESRVRLVRTVRRYGPDGNSVARTEIKDAVITSDEPLQPDDIASRPYIEFGDWIIADFINKPIGGTESE